MMGRPSTVAGGSCPPLGYGRRDGGWLLLFGSDLLHWKLVIGHFRPSLFGSGSAGLWDTCAPLPCYAAMPRPLKFV